MGSCIKETVYFITFITVLWDIKCALAYHHFTELILLHLTVRRSMNVAELQSGVLGSYEKKVITFKLI